MMWYTGGSFVNCDEGWYVLPVEPSGGGKSADPPEYDDVFLTCKTPGLLSFTAPREPAVTNPNASIKSRARFCYAALVAPASS